MWVDYEKIKGAFISHLYQFKWGWPLMMVGVLGWLDYATGHALRFAPFYLLPISFVTWTRGKKEGLAMSIVCTAVWFTSNLLAGQFYPLWVALWNIFIRQFSYSIFVFVLATLKKQADQAQHDYLTEIFNKRIFHECANRELARCRRYRKPITVGYIDCDDFKQVNDREGHDAGDRLLQAVAKTIQKELRATDVVARMGGDEFAVLLPSTDYAASEEVFAKVRRQLLSVSEKYRHPVTFSMGVVTFRSSPATVRDMLERADQLMYAVKKTTKNNIEHEVVYERSEAV